MDSFEKKLVAFRQVIDANGNPPFAEGEIERLASEVRVLLEVSDDEFERIVGVLKEQFTITLETGHSIKDDTFYPWWSKYKVDAKRLAYWGRFNQFLKGLDYLSPQVVNRLDAETDEIIDLVGDPNKEGSWHRSGMVIGHVQSGKTQNYSAVICKAADAGYKVIILFAGLTNSLRRQTQDRINQAFIGRKASRNQRLMSELYGVGKISKYPVPDAGTHLEGDFSASALSTAIGFNIANRTEPIIFVCKKNAATLRNLNNYFNTISENDVDLPLLLIDDEADNASVNTKADKNQITAINAGLRNILHKFQRSSYLGYTATPFANVFIDPDDTINFGSDDLFPANYIRTLEAPSNYVGADRVFGEEGDLFERMVVEIDDYQSTLNLDHKNHHPVKGLPASLELAVIHFIIAKAVRVLRGDGKKHCTMMINVSRFNSVQHSVEGLVYELVEHIKEDLKLNANSRSPSSSSFIHKFKSEYKAEFLDKINDEKGEYPEWSELKSEFFNGWDVRVRSVNMAGGALDYDAHSDEGLTLIAIGGLALSRGLTLEGLCSSYILRNASAYDTLMQMGRWFGYRHNYEDLCRLYLPKDSIDHYQETSKAINELREEVEFMASENLTPTEFGLKVRQSPNALRITAANKMRTAKELTLDIGYAGRMIEGHTVHLNDKINSSNLEATRSFIKSLGEPNQSEKVEVANTLLWTDVAANEILTLLDGFDFPAACTHLTKINKTSFVYDFISSKNLLLNDWNVHLNNMINEPRSKESNQSNGFLDHLFDGYQVLPRKRTGLIFEESKVYKITQRRRVGSANDSKVGLFKSDYDELIKKKPNSTDRDFRSHKNFKPTLIVYLINPEDKYRGLLPYSDCVVSLGLHFPRERLGLETTKQTYQVNRVYQQMEFNLNIDKYEEDEINEILSEGG